MHAGGMDAQNSAAEPPLKQPDVQGLKHFKTLLPLFARLHNVGCERDTAGNRKLFFDGYCALVMLYLFNPLLSSMNALQQALKLPNVAKALGVKPFSAGSFSEAPEVFKPEMLREIIGELAKEAKPLEPDAKLKDLKLALTLVDSTVLSGLPRLASAACEKTRVGVSRNGRAVYGWRMHMQLDLASFVPRRVDVAGGCNAGEFRETNVLRRALEANRCYTGDGGYADRELMDDVVKAKSGHVFRVREDIVFEVVTEKELSQAALDAGVVRDVLMRWGDQTVRRLVELKVKPHPHRTRTGKVHSDRLLIVTSYFDLEAELVALVYQQRYSVELFFRFLKGMAGMGHLLSQREEGMAIQSYCAVIACLIISLAIGRRPDKRTMEMLGFFLLGLADEGDVLKHLNKPDNRGKKALDELFKKCGF